MITARPSPASRSISAKISDLAPTSMPRVGSSTTITFRPRISQRASSTFCWLPPDRYLICLVEARRLDAETVDEVLHRAALLAFVEEAATWRSCVERGEAGILQTGSSSISPSLLRSSVSSPMPSAHAGARVVRASGAAVDRDRARADRIEADDRLGEFGAAGAHQAEEAEHLAGARLEATRRELGVGRAGPRTDRATLLPGRAARAGEQVVDAPPDHVLDQACRWCARRSAWSRCAGRRAARSRVSAISKTSSSLWLT